MRNNENGQSLIGIIGYELNSSIGGQKPKTKITGSYPRPDTSYCPRDGRLPGSKSERPYHKDRRVQTIIDEVTLQPCPLLRRSIKIRILTSDRNRQKRPQKWRHSSVRELAHRITRTAALNRRRSDRRYLFQ
jgi:hypothetical protein